MDPVSPTLPIIILGLFIALFYDPILGMIVMLLGFLAMLVMIDPSHSYIAMYMILPLVILLTILRIFWKAIPEERRLYLIILYMLLATAIAASLGHDYSSLFFAPLFVLPILGAFFYDPSGKLAVIVLVAIYAPYSAFTYYVVRSVRDVKSHPMIGKEGIVVRKVTQEGGMIKIGNTFRDAVTDSKIPIEVGSRVIVVDVKPSLTLVVKRA